MIHFREIIFKMLDKGMSNQEILEEVRKFHGMELTLPRVQNYRTVHGDPAKREAFLAGKLDLLGNLL